MLSKSLVGLRNHAHVLLILPVIILVMTWPTAARVFDSDRFWVHNHTWDVFHRLWDSWHLGQVLAGQAQLWYSVDTFHPHGASLLFQNIVFPHALLVLALKPVLPPDNANNLIFLLTLCFNGISAYVLILHLLKDKWVALFGAVVAATGISFSSKGSDPVLIIFGTMPLSLYFFHRALHESRFRFAALAGVCAGITAFIGLYTFAFILIGAATYAAYLLPARLRQSAYWRLLLLFAVICAAISTLRLYPILADAAIRQEGLAKYASYAKSHDLLNYFVHSRNPFTGGLLHSVFNVPPGEIHKNIYLGYINLFFLACALLSKARRKRLLPWLALFVFFALMRLGDFLTFNSVPYRDIVLPARVLRDIFPTLFGQIGFPNYYIYALITPFAVLSSFGLAALIRGRSARTRALAALAAVLVVSFEYYAPLTGLSVPKGATAYVDWLKSEPDDPIKLINLPRERPIRRYALYGQTLTGYPTAYGYLWRTLESTTTYSTRNWLLREWSFNRSGSCFGRAQAYQEALDELLADGFSHVVFHRWAYQIEESEHSFVRVPVAYGDGLVAIYRLRDMRLACADLPPVLAEIDLFLNSPWGAWQPGSSLLSFHPRDRINEEQFAYLDASIANTTGWDGLLHLYFDEGKLSFQAAADGILTVEEFTEQSQAIYVVHASGDTDLARITRMSPLDQFQQCGRQTLEGNWVIERLLRREFSCALFASPTPLEARYDNGAHLANMLVTLDDDHLEIQMRWDALPISRHAISIQFFDMAGSKALNQDLIVGDLALANHRVEISSLRPGNYAVKLIFYDFKTGNSVSGVVSQTGVRFERELEIATIERS